MEVALAVNPLYGCCVTSGGLAAFDLATGAALWYLPTIEQASRADRAPFPARRETRPERVLGLVRARLRC